MARNLSTNSGTDVVGPELERELDRLSVEQALRDFEIANARTIDVTQRLVDLSTEVRELRERLVSTQEALAAARRREPRRSVRPRRSVSPSSPRRSARACAGEAADPPRTLVAVLVYGGAEFVPACIESLAGSWSRARSTGWCSTTAVPTRRGATPSASSARRAAWGTTARRATWASRGT